MDPAENAASGAVSGVFDDLTITASEVGAEIETTTVTLSELDAIFAACPSMPAADRAAWKSFEAAYNGFIDRVNENVHTILPWSSNWGTFYEGNFQTVLSEIRAYQAKAVEWQRYANAHCGATNLPSPYGPNPPPPPGDSILWTAIKWGAVGLATATAIVIAAPYVEAAFGSRVGSAAIAGARRGAAATGRAVKRGIASSRRLAHRT